MDRLIIRDLRIPARVGVSAQERSQPQYLLIGLEIEVDLAKAGASDELADTVDYHATVDAVGSLVESTEARLLEHMAERVAALLLRTDGVASVAVEIAKERPPIDEDIGKVAVRVERAART